MITEEQLSKCQALIDLQTQQELAREEKLRKLLKKGGLSMKELCRKYGLEQEDVHAVPGDVTEADKSVDKDTSEKDEDCDDETAAVADDDNHGNDEEIDEKWEAELKVNKLIIISERKLIIFLYDFGCM